MVLFKQILVVQKEVILYLAQSLLQEVEQVLLDSLGQEMVVQVVEEFLLQDLV